MRKFGLVFKSALVAVLLLAATVVPALADGWPPHS
jgi:hypothetical protein